MYKILRNGLPAPLALVLRTGDTWITRKHCPASLVNPREPGPVKDPLQK